MRQRFSSRARILVSLSFVAWFAPAPLAAQNDDARTLRATILHIDGDDIVIDAGHGRVADAQTLTVYRAIEVRHPITHKTLRDRFAIGTLTVVQTGETLSVAKANGAPSHPFAVGDAVEAVLGARGSPPQPVPAAATAVAEPSPKAAQASTRAAGAREAASAPSAAPAPTSEERDLAAAWYATLAQPPARRAEIYAALLARYPDSRYRGYIEREIGYLRELDRQSRAPSEVLRTLAAQRAAIVLQPVHSAEEGEAVDLAGLLRDHAKLRSVLLHARPLEASAYVTYPVAVDERGHARVQLPGSIAEAPGFAYFVEGVDAEGKTVPLLGGASTPEIAVVRRKTHPAPPTAPTTSVRFQSELVSFDGLSGRDYFLLTEGDFLYRVRYGRLYGVRVGYGNYRGEGGTVDELDRLKLAPRPAGFTYGFIETEFELHRLLGIATRATVGLGRPDDPASQRKGLTGGFQLRARIGAADGTHLVLAGELMPEIGQRAYLGLHFAPIAQLPMATEVVVTDQPVNSDELAVRLIYEIGYRVSDRIAVALRPSYELRTIAHAGPGIGMAATFDW